MSCTSLITPRIFCFGWPVAKKSVVSLLDLYQEITRNFFQDIAKKLELGKLVYSYKNKNKS